MSSESERDVGAIAEQIELRAGPVSLIYQDGCIRYLRTGDREILRRIYAAVRDEQWRTVPAQIRDLRVEHDDNSYQITFAIENKAWGDQYLCTGHTEDRPDG